VQCPLLSHGGGFGGIVNESSGIQPKMAQTIFTLSPEMQESWDYVMGQMLSFVNDTNADVDMAYDFVCEQLDIDSFVDNKDAWDDFYTYWEAADNRNTMVYAAI